MTELLHSSLCSKARLLQRAELSSVELTRHYLDRIERFDSQLGSYLALNRSEALAQAEAADKSRSRGEPQGPLAGMPIALKDVLVTKNLETTAASEILKGWVPPYDATVVQRLRNAGAVILGKLNMDEFAMGSSNENSSVAPCRNPWDNSRVPGGSSGGSAAAVAADLCAASLGTDTGGSIRQPAAFCGVVGLKPSYGRVSRYGVVAFASSLDQVGPITKTVEDSAVLLQAIAGFDPRDATSIEAELPDFSSQLQGDVRGLRIGVARELDIEGMSPEIRDHTEAALARFVELGAELVEVALPHTRYALPAYYLIAPAEASSNLARYDGVRFGHRAVDQDDLENMYGRTRATGFGAEVIRRIMLGTYALRSGYYDDYYKKAQQVRTLIRADFVEAFKKVDVIASATTPTTAFHLGARSKPLDMYQSDLLTLSCNLAGLPGISVPNGLDSAGLPVGLQLLGRPLQEATLLKAAAAYERIAPSPPPEGFA